ncbi:MAG: MBL fold metallo-hydrolase [Sphingomonas phyllosphaerae]
MLTDPPRSDEIEVSIFSRGYGESILVHLKNGRWIIIDSLETEHKAPVALQYLRAMELEPENCVDALLLTHWHDDHVAGATALVSCLPKSIIALSSFLQGDEFKTFLRTRGFPTSGSYGNGLKELIGVCTLLKDRDRPRKWCSADKLISADRINGSYKFEALSPSEHDFEDFVESIAALGGEGTRIPAPRRNDASVASVVEFPDEMLLFGADLEIGSSGKGWVAVHELVWKGRRKASFFKIPHHGSKNAHYPPIWADMLVENVTAALTPWNRSAKLPTREDVARILEGTESAYAAAKPLNSAALKRQNAVERQTRAAGIKIATPASDLGHLRFRKSADTWAVSYANDISSHLSDIFKHSA